MATRIKSQARDHPRFRRVCINIAQRLHRVDVRLRLGLLRDSPPSFTSSPLTAAAATGSGTRRVVVAATESRVRSNIPVPRGQETGTMNLPHAASPTPHPSPATSAAVSKHRIRPLSESKAIDLGANFLSEAFLFCVAASVILVESLRSRRKEATRRDAVQERLSLLEARKRQDEQRIRELENRVATLEGRAAPSRHWVPTPLWEPSADQERSWWLWRRAPEEPDKSEAEKGGQAETPQLAQPLPPPPPPPPPPEKPQTEKVANE